MSDLFFFNLFLAVLWLQPSPPPFRYTRTYMKTCKIKIKFSNLIFSKTKLQMKKNSKFNFRIISPFVESSPFFFSFFQSYYNYKDHPSQMKPGEISRIKFNFLFENQIKKKKKYRSTFSTYVNFLQIESHLSSIVLHPPYTKKQK